MEIVDLFKEKSATPCAPVHPVHNFLYGVNYLLSGLEDE